MSTFLKLDEIEAGSIWTSADGTGKQVQVTGFDFDTDDVLVRPLNGPNQHLEYKLDTFKFQYRYMPLEA